MKIVAYAYEAALHCPDCTWNKASVGLLRRQPPLQLGADEHGITFDLVDREGNPVHPVYDIGEGLSGECCDDCRAPLD